MSDMRKKLPIYSASRGFSLVELMVALALGAFLLLGVVNVFITSKKTALVENALARVQENGRLTLDLLSDDFMRMGYRGCNSVSSFMENMVSNFDYVGLRGYERGASGWSPALPDAGNDLLDLQNVAVTGSDLLHIQIARSMPTATLTGPVTPNDASIRIANNPDCAFKQNSMAIIADCINANLFLVTNAPACSSADPGGIPLTYAPAGNATVRIDPGYDRKAEVMLFEDIEWYVADTGRVRNDFPVFALFRRVNGTAQEMVEGVENMQLLYGQRGNQGTRYLNAGDASIDWDAVTTVRLALLIQSFEPVRNDADLQTYQLLDQNIGAPDSGAQGIHSGGRAMRRVFSTTLLLRNTDY